MKKSLLIFAACAMAAAASAQTMNVHLKDGTSVQYASEEVDYVDFTPKVEEAPESNDLEISYDEVNFTPDYVLLYWNEAEGATSYEYRVTDASGTVVQSGTYSYTYMVLHGLEAGTTYKLSIIPDNGEASVISLTTPSVKRAVTGTYEKWFSTTGASYSYGPTADSQETITVDLYDNNTVTIKNWYGVEGYNLNLAISEDGALSVLSDYSASGGWYYIECGVDGTWTYLYPDAASLEDGSFSVSFYVGYNWFQFYENSTEVEE